MMKSRRKGATDAVVGGWDRSPDWRAKDHPVLTAVRAGAVGEVEAVDHGHRAVGRGASGGLTTGRTVRERLVPFEPRALEREAVERVAQLGPGPTPGGLTGSSVANICWKSCKGVWVEPACVRSACSTSSSENIETTSVSVASSDWRLSIGKGEVSASAVSAMASSLRSFASPPVSAPPAQEMGNNMSAVSEALRDVQATRELIREGEAVIELA